MTDNKLLTEAEALAEAKKTVDRLDANAKSHSKTLKDLLATTGGKLQFPKPNLNALSIIETDGHGVDGVKNICIVLWALLNQNNDEILNFNQKQKEAAWFELGKELDIDDLDEIMTSISQVLGGQDDPTKSTRKKGKNKK